MTMDNEKKTGGRSAMQLIIVANRNRTCNWVGELMRRMERRCGAENVALELADGPELPAATRLLLDFERLVFRLGRSGLGAPMAPPMRAHRRHTGKADFAIDVSGRLPEAHPHADRTLAVLANGMAGDEQLFCALLDGQIPTIEVVDVGSGSVMASGKPAVDNGATVVQSADDVYARILSLIDMALDQPKSGRPVETSAVGRHSSVAIAAALLRRLAQASARRLYGLCCYAPHWRLGYRFVEGDGMFERRDVGGASWHVLRDTGHEFYADPFPIAVNGRHYIFFENFDHRAGKAVISYAEVFEGGGAGPVHLALETPHHLSYPFLIEADSEIYMIPESSDAREVAVYRAERFPDRWVKESVLVSGLELSDATIVDHNGRNWMFATLRDGYGSHSDTLCIYSSADLLHGWRPHARNPVLIDRGCARPGGAFIKRQGKLWRTVQDCSAGYGRGVGFTEVTELTETAFSETLQDIIRPGPSWAGSRLHTFNRHGALECIDGSAHSVRLWRNQPAGSSRTLSRTASAQLRELLE